MTLTGNATNFVVQSKLVACDPPGIGPKKVQETYEARFGSTYVVNYCSVPLECAIVDLRCAFNYGNSTALEVACPAPRIEAKKFQLVLFSEKCSG
jgi:hypothetical protein